MEKTNNKKKRKNEIKIAEKQPKNKINIKHQKKTQKKKKNKKK